MTESIPSGAEILSGEEITRLNILLVRHIQRHLALDSDASRAVSDMYAGLVNGQPRTTRACRSALAHLEKAEEAS